MQDEIYLKVVDWLFYEVVTLETPRSMLLPRDSGEIVELYKHREFPAMASR